MVVDNNCVMILWAFQIQTDKQVMANQSDILVVEESCSDRCGSPQQQQNQEEGRRKKKREIPRIGGEDVWSEDISDPLGHCSTWSCEHPAGGMASADPRSNIGNLCPEDAMLETAGIKSRTLELLI